MYPLGIILLELHVKFDTGHEKVQLFRDIKKYHKVPQWFIDQYEAESELVLALTEI